MKGRLYGTLAAFVSEEAYLAALAGAVRKGFGRIDTFTPYPVEREDEVLRRPPSRVRWITLWAGIVGGASAFYMQWYAARDFPLNVGGRPLNSWPSFIPITFELTVLSAALVGTFALLWIAGLPRLDHPAFADPRFERASQDRFFICIRADDPAYSPAAARGALMGAHPESVEEVSA